MLQARAVLALPVAVSVDKLTSQLRRDLAANPRGSRAGPDGPGHALLLGPAGFEVHSGRRHRNKEDERERAELTDDPIELREQPGKTGLRSRFRWEKVRQQIEGDEHMRSAEFDLAGRSLWSAGPRCRTSGARRRATDGRPRGAGQEHVSAIDPQSVGLSLGGILVGSGRRLAIVNGQICRQGDVVSILDKRDKSTTYEFHVHSIRGQSVPLEIGGRIFLAGAESAAIGPWRRRQARKTNGSRLSRAGQAPLRERQLVASGHARQVKDDECRAGCELRC